MFLNKLITKGPEETLVKRGIENLSVTFKKIIIFNYCENKMI
jgi:hypothetical protein